MKMKNLSFLVLIVIAANILTFTYTPIANAQVQGTTTSGELRITAELEEDDNQFTEDDYEVQEFTMALPGVTLVCPSNNCSYELEDGEFRKNTFSGVWMLQGDLKVGQQQEGGIENSIYDLRADLDRMSSFESNDGSVTERLFGGLEMRLPGTTIPIGSYSITNSTITFGEEPLVLTLQGVRSD